MVQPSELSGMRHFLLFFVLGAIGFSIAAQAQQPKSLSYNRDVRPILSNNCFQCHGFDVNTRESGLRLDTIEGATAELESGDGQAIVPGNAKESVLLDRVIAHDSDQMPPADSGKEISAAQIEVLRTWIEQGAKYESHWSFVAPQPERKPTVADEAWPKNYIDYFVLAKLEKENLSPSPAADKRNLIRRVALDVTGLPPTLKQVDQFLADDSTDAYEKMVDRFLDSPRYGEHMAKRWLDLARYADTSGYQYDKERTMWVWRDWVINAYNENKPFDQFTVEQLAGDLIPNATDQQILATGFNRNHPITIEGGVIDEEYRTEYVIDRLNTTTTVWLGLTVACARCHDHKFDPISQKEFYQLSAYFNQVAERGLNGFEPMRQIASPLAEPPTPELVAQMDEIAEQIKSLSNPADDQVVLEWAAKITATETKGWEVLDPFALKSTGGSEMKKQPDSSVIVGGANPRKDIYEIEARSDLTGITAVRLQCLTDDSLPGGGPGRHSNSNFVLSEFELVAVSVSDPTKKQKVKFTKAMADYSQANYGIEKAIDGTVSNNNGWAVDGPSRKEKATAIFVADSKFGFADGTKLQFRLRHEASFATHGIGRPRFSITQDPVEKIEIEGTNAAVNVVLKKDATDRTVEDRVVLKEAFEVERATLRKRLEEKQKSLSPVNRFPKTMVMKDLASPRKTHVLTRGQYDLKGDIVSPGTLAVLNPIPNDVPKNRLGLAKWLVDPKNPLTARVAVNRHWQMLFGTGLVKSLEDFGTQGDLPSHPALLDSLATNFVSSGWDVKRLLRTMLNSAAYRQSSKVNAKLLERDPDNRLLARGPRFRLDAEQARDQALAISGLLSPKIGGPSVYPYQPKGLWMELNNRPGYSREYVAGKGESLYRRSVYTFWKRTVLSPMLTTFDAPGREFCTVSRSRTNTPLQALLLLQGPQFVEAARQLAARMMVEGGEGVSERIGFGFQLATSRVPTKQETEILARLFEDRLSRFKSAPEAAIKMLSVGDSPRNTQLESVEHAAWMEVARLLLNLDETINRD
ncbi:MAG: PSD1 and planctomycete cytochrome C domain-containing protein [Mariniblastus sp.]